jgi:hypothetical protein
MHCAPFLEQRIPVNPEGPNSRIFSDPDNDDDNDDNDDDNEVYFKKYMFVYKYICT